MEKITKYFRHDYEDDTTIEYVNTGKYSMLNCSFTSEDPDYGTDTIHSKPAEPPKPVEQMAYEMLEEISSHLDEKVRSVAYDGYSNTTLYAIEKVLKDLAGDYEPNPTKWLATVENAGKIIADRMLSGKCNRFALCQVNTLLMETMVPKYFRTADGEGWYGVKRIESLFDNSDRELIVAVGYWGGGNCSLAYVDEENTDTSEPAREIARAICDSTGLEMDNVIFVKEDDEDE